MSLKPGDRVVVIDGLARGERGVVFGLARIKFGDIPVWTIDFPLPMGARSIREDYLQREERGVA